MAWASANCSLNWFVEAGEASAVDEVTALNPECWLPVYGPLTTPALVSDVPEREVPLEIECWFGVDAAVTGEPYSRGSTLRVE